jgi:MFS transporter, PAT family, beta-lactamase induction signal transducer AmpG
MKRRGPHPARFAVLIVPFGAAFGMVLSALPALATQNGIAESTAIEIVGSTYLVHTLKPLWAPLLDTTLTRRTWYLIGNGLVSLGILAVMAMPISEASLGILWSVVLASQVGLSVMGMTVEGFLGLTVPEEEKGAASGWFNAGYLGAVGVGGWLLLKLTEWLPARWMAGAVVAAMMLPCALPLIGLRIPPADEHAPSLGMALRQLGRDLVAQVKSRPGLTGLLIALSPVGAAAAQNAFSAIAGRWGIGASYHLQALGMTFDSFDVIGAVNGLGQALLSGAGALVGGWLSDRMPRRLAYLSAGLALAITAVLMAAGPRDPLAWVIFGSVYNFFAGVALAAFTSFVLETIGRGAVATKYNIFAGCSNLAIWYTTTLDQVALGRGGAAWGTTALLFTDAGLSVAGCALLLAVFLRSRRA